MNVTDCTEYGRAIIGRRSTVFFFFFFFFWFICPSRGGLPSWWIKKGAKVSGEGANKGLFRCEDVMGILRNDGNLVKDDGVSDLVVL